MSPRLAPVVVAPSSPPEQEEPSGPFAYRARVWGRRDAWAWAMGLLGLLSLSLVLRAEGVSVARGMNAVLVLGCGAYWWGWRPMREGIFLVALVSGVVAWGVYRTAPARELLMGLYAGLAWFSTRHRLFFRIDVSDAALTRSWRSYMSPRIVYVAFALTCLELVLLPLAFVCVPMWLGILGRVDPMTGAPLIRRRTSVAGLVMSLVFAWVGFVALYHFFSAR